MDDLRRRFASLDRLPAPDLWNQIEHRTTALGSPERLTPVSPPALSRQRGFNARPIMALLAAVALLVGLLAGAIAVGTRISEQPAIVPQVPTPRADVTPIPSPSSSPSPSPAMGLVAYTVTVQLEPGESDGIDVCAGPAQPIHCSVDRLWVANRDGTDARELPGQSGDQELLAWSPDGVRLLYRDRSTSGLGLTDVTGSAPKLIPYDALCPVDNCPFMDYFAFSPDGTRLSYVIDVDDGETVIVFYDLATGAITKLESTATTNPRLPCDTAAHEGVNDSPRWSPDGRRLVFARQVIGPQNKAGYCKSALYVVNVDGTDLHKLVGSDLWPLDPHWSPDGSLIVFRREEIVPNVDPDAVPVNVDVYTIRPDGSEIRSLTTDGMSMLPRWTADGRIVFVRWVAVDEYDLWIMDADGGNQAQIPSKRLADLAAVGCIVCPRPASGGGTDAMWQPTP